MEGLGFSFSTRFTEEGRLGGKNANFHVYCQILPVGVFIPMA